MSADQRPLSPHLQIFRPIITMVMSILHRITGAGIYVGTILLVWWFAAAAAGPEHYAAFSGFIGSWFGRLVLFGLTWALIHHLLGGIRHLIWDAGYGFDPPVANALSWATIIGSVVLTLVIWTLGYVVM
jgi:succinate dehydrogenase / fumarate reductase, cytochrome b subunit